MGNVPCQWESTARRDLKKEFLAHAIDIFLGLTIMMK